MKKYTVVAALMTLMVAITLTIAGSSYAANEQADSSKKLTTEQHKQAQETIQKAVENNDYATWKSTIESMPYGKKKEGKLTQETFDKMVAAKKLHTDIQTATKNGDYTTWKSLVAKAKNGEEKLKVIDTEAKFKTFVEAHKLIEDGRAKMKQGHDKMKELGFKKPGMNKKKLGAKGMRGGMMKGGFKMMK